MSSQKRIPKRGTDAKSRSLRRDIRFCRAKEINMWALVVFGGWTKTCQGACLAGLEGRGKVRGGGGSVLDDVCLVCLVCLLDMSDLWSNVYECRRSGQVMGNVLGCCDQAYILAFPRLPFMPKMGCRWHDISHLDLIRWLNAMRCAKKHPIIYTAYQLTNPLLRSNPPRN